MKKAVYPGTFDPFTNGHLDIVKRAAKLFDEVHILISYNINKKNIFTPTERVKMIKDCCKDFSNIIVESYDGLVVDYCEKNNIDVIIRGIRNFSDYENELSLFNYNKAINKNIETIFLFPSSENQFISSHAIKELISFNCDISQYVPKIVEEILKQKLH